MKRTLCAFLAVLLLLSAVSVSVFAAPDTVKQTKRAIAIVFDNSGSMYLPGDNGSESEREQFRYAWCRATYAMEAFATMMNASDVMQIYPMHPIEVGGKTYSADAPLTITQKTAATIRDIYTPKPLGTPIETITTACKGLEKQSADERWLIVLTDGDRFYKNGSDLGPGDGSLKPLQSVLDSCKQKVNVMYLGIGKQAIKPKDGGGKYQFIADKADSSSQVLAKLTAMCNTIFGRDTLPDVKNKISFDVSMSKVIVFVQGKGIKDVKLGDKKPALSSDMKYATKGGGGQAKGEFKVDESLQGVLLTYTDLDAGEYPLSYSGTATSVVCYYEPDVDMSAQMLDATGTPVSTDSELMAGTYTLQFHLVDKNGKATTSSLLGTTKYEITYTINGTAKTATFDKSGKIELEMQPNDEIDVSFKVTYLGGYTITRTSGDLGWPSGGLKFLPPPAGKLDVKLSGGAKEYSLSKLPQGEKYRVEFFYKDAPCTAAQLGRIEATAKVTGGKVGCKLDRDDQGYFVMLDYAGTPLETECGNFELLVTGVYTNEDNLKTNIASAKAEFTLKDDSRTLEMELQRDQDYYQLSQLASGKPILVKLAFSGQPLTEAEMKGLKVTCQANGVKVKLEPDYANSCYVATFDPQDPPAKGSYGLTFTAVGKNEIGREMTATKKTRVEFGLLPQWLRLVLPIAIALFLAFLIWLYMKQPVLPKQVELTNVDYRVDGDAVAGKVKPYYTGGGKKTGEVRISSPKYSMDPMAQQGVTLTLQAVTPRWVKSKQRKALVTDFRLNNASHVISLRLKTSNFNPNPDNPREFVLTNTGKPMAKPLELGANTPVNIMSDTGTSSAMFQCTMKFR